MNGKYTTVVFAQTMLDGLIGDLLKMLEGTKIKMSSYQPTMVLNVKRTVIIIKYYNTKI